MLHARHGGPNGGQTPGMFLKVGSNYIKKAILFDSAYDSEYPRTAIIQQGCTESSPPTILVPGIFVRPQRLHSYNHSS